jgi:two-component system sensor histidine kinase/response regulator
MNTNDLKETKTEVHVLIAEDSLTQAQRLRFILERHGYQVDAAANGLKALEMVRARRPTLIISDIVMPEMDGYQLCQQIKADPALKSLPVILVTTLSDPQDVIRGLECGADNFIIKPYDERYLLSRIQFVLLNYEIRQVDRAEMGVEIFFNGQRHFITADRLQILNLLLSTYEAAIERNHELTRTKDELRATNVSLEAANKELEAFSYSVSHDLRAPLRAIEGFSRILVEEHAPKLDDTARNLLQRSQNACQRMGQLIDDLLNLSRLSYGEMRRDSTDLSALARSIFAELHNREPGRNVTFQVAEGTVVNGDARLLRVALENLLGNAWKFTSKRSDAVIEFGTTSQDGERVYYVRDNGAGFDMAYADQLFGAFRRLHSTDEFPGTGVGLATVRRVINRHGGRIWAKSVIENGATFYFTL